MPKFGTHLMIAEIAAQNRPDLFNGQLLSNAGRLGAVGPDLMLFLFDPFFSDRKVKDGFNVVVKIMVTMDEIKEKISKLEDLIGSPGADLVDLASGGLSTSLMKTVESAMEITILTLKLGVAMGMSSLNFKNPLFEFFDPLKGKLDVTGFVNKALTEPTILIDASDNVGFPFRYFGHPFTDDGDWIKPKTKGDYSEWWWMDILHYRKTGDFAQNLLKIAKQSGDNIAYQYAQGYLSHVAGDICGHPFINSIVGGPFRNHAYRHMVLEGLADTWLWHHQYKKDITSSKLHELIKLDESQFRSVARLIISSMKATYPSNMVPKLIKGDNGFPSEDDLYEAYGTMFLYLKLSTNSGFAMPEPPADTPEELIEEIQTILGRNDPAGTFPSHDPGNQLESIIAILGWLFRGLIFLVMVATLPFAVLMRFLTIAPRWAIFLINLGLYKIISGLRTLLVLMGWGYASFDDFDNFDFLESFITVDKELNSNYPFDSTERPKTSFYWLVHPRNAVSTTFQRTKLELNPTLVAPIQHGTQPNWIIDRTNNLMHTDLEVLNNLNNLPYPNDNKKVNPNNDPKNTENVVRKLFEDEDSQIYGNAVDFYIKLLDGYDKPVKLDEFGNPVKPVEILSIPNLDLDGDRGYAYRSWEGTPPDEEKYL
jgi:Zinc dependent phospholipase C